MGTRAPTILIADDDKDLVHLMATALTKAGHEVLACYDGEEALTVIQERAPHIDLVILDVLMPKLDGVEVAQRIKNNPATDHIPILLCTGQGEETIVKGLDVGGVDYITKPFSTRQLLVRVGVVLQRYVKANHQREAEAG